MKAVIFDLDGTLIDNFQALYASYCHMTEVLGYPAVSLATFRRSIGGSIPVTLQKLIGDAPLKPAVDVYTAHYQTQLTHGATVLPGVTWLLEALLQKGHRLCVLTNKTGDEARLLCAHLGLDSYFEAIIGVGDTPYRKPERAFSEHALRVLDLPANEVAFVGDSNFDYEAATSVGMECYLVATGSHSECELRELQSAGVFADAWALGRYMLDSEACANITKGSA